jgi:hypothetical protein
MRRINLKEVMDEVTIAMLTDAENVYVYEDVDLYTGVAQNSVATCTVKVNLHESRENQEEAVNKFIELMETLNAAFNRSVGAPESMRVFKVLETKTRYAGNDTVAVELVVATLMTGTETAVNVLLSGFWGTKKNFTIVNVADAGKTYSLGNALRSWKAVMKKYGQVMNVNLMPAVLINYVQ